MGSLEEKINNLTEEELKDEHEIVIEARMRTYKREKRQAVICGIFTIIFATITTFSGLFIHTYGGCIAAISGLWMLVSGTCLALKVVHIQDKIDEAGYKAQREFLLGLYKSE